MKRSLKAQRLIGIGMQPRDLSAHDEYVAGRGHEEVAAARGIDPSTLITLSSNENPLGPSPAAVSAIRDYADKIHRYPKAVHTALTEHIADHWGVHADQVWLASGGDGALDYLSRAMLRPGARILVPSPGFAYYRMSAQFHHAHADTYRAGADPTWQLEAEAVLDAYEDHRIVYLTSPHNPTGQSVSIDTIRTIAERTDQETLLVVDEAYGEFSETPSAQTLFDEREDVAVLRSFSKAYGLAGVRLGYAIVPDSWASAYRRINTPFAVNALACRAGLAALDDQEHLTSSVDLATWGRSYFHKNLTAKTWPSEGNFILAAVGDATAVTDALEARGILVRDCSSFGLPHCIRITVGRRSEVRKATDLCNEILSEATE